MVKRILAPLRVRTITGSGTFSFGNDMKNEAYYQITNNYKRFDGSRVYAFSYIEISVGKFWIREYLGLPTQVNLYSWSATGWRGDYSTHKARAMWIENTRKSRVVTGQYFFVQIDPKELEAISKNYEDINAFSVQT